MSFNKKKAFMIFLWLFICNYVSGKIFAEKNILILILTFMIFFIGMIFIDKFVDRFCPPKNKK